ncbi:MAG: leucyl/phenylalanyl-tRNA--protein transferase [Hydrogenovibrio sp.]|uniref:leucyl/phenylalanyl-tRNA--protein transferase n=1 Tax=Hydrogenovibrio sp. TaxID=2065821 RepID=UPI002870019E|nr:leucyl/phenylalanyl-tRNA--protein transferase [Hydrogenovibrio sp.]MDR9497791.1 leucyl/phenylalanyl-tRNA--protein transferase [Hydrogenovibrio sp.]
MHTKPLSAPFWLDPHPVAFPPTHLALNEPDGLLAIGGDLTSEWLLSAYQKGIFPWYAHDDPILWWTPNPRSVLFTDAIHLSKSLRKRLRQQRYRVTFDQDFTQVMSACAHTPRPDQDGTWILPEMIQAYERLFQQGHAHSVEVWEQEELVGGLYGVVIGRMFYGESMFSRHNDASKIALVALCTQLRQWGFRLIDTQVATDHLQRLGARLVSREHFETLLDEQIHQSGPTDWQLAEGWEKQALTFAEAHSAAPSS